MTMSFCSKRQPHSQPYTEKHAMLTRVDQNIILRNSTEYFLFQNMLLKWSECSVV